MFRSIVVVFSLTFLAGVSSAKNLPITPSGFVSYQNIQCIQGHQALSSNEATGPIEQITKLNLNKSAYESFYKPSTRPVASMDQPVVVASSGGFSFLAFLLCSIFTKRKTKIAEANEDVRGDFDTHS